MTGHCESCGLEEEGLIMKVISIVEYDNSSTTIVKLQEMLDPDFAKVVKNFPAWKNISDEELLCAQTFIAWVRQKPNYTKKSIQDCLENEQYSWSDSLEIEEV